MKPRMNVYLTTAKKVFMYAYPVIRSLFEQNMDSEVYLYLVSENLEETDILVERELAERHGGHIIILHFDEEMARGKIVSTSDHWPLGTLGCYWLFHELLPGDVDRILALESDAVVTGSLREFYDTDLTEYYAACPDPRHKPETHRKLMERLGGDVLTFVVSVYDVQAIRRDFTLDQILETDRFVVKEFGHSQQELTFGILFRDRIKFLPAADLCVEQNSQSMAAMGIAYLTACENTCKVLHFSSTMEREKPWNPVFIMPGYAKWWRYAKESPYYQLYFEEQWKLYRKKTAETEALKKNITYKNVLLMTLAVYTLLVLAAGIWFTGTAKGVEAGQALAWVGIVIGALAVSAVCALAVRRVSMWLIDGNGQIGKARKR